jgi:hypothetical protein
MSWQDLVNAVRPSVVKIETPNGFGTGFLTFYTENGACGIATAAHVISHADSWQQPLKIWAERSGPILLGGSDRVIFIDHNTDSAVILFLPGDLQLPQFPVALLPPDQPCSIGTSIGWLGFPVLEPWTHCFFSGTVSAHRPSSRSYLIDGVAINGVSGGPVFCGTHTGDLRIIGMVSAYQANRTTGETLPGLLRAQDVSHFFGVLRHVRDIEDAAALKREFESDHSSPQSQPQSSVGGEDG